MEKVFRNWIKGLTGIELGLTNLVNMASATFYQIISTKVSLVMLLIQCKYWKLEGNGKTAKNFLDASITSRQKQREKTC